MLFNSITYLVFLPVVFLLFYYTGNKYKWSILLLASYIFYASLLSPSLILVLVLVTLVTYLFGISIHVAAAQQSKKILFRLAVSINIIILLYLKYLGFIIGNSNILLGFFSLGKVPFHFVVMEYIGVSYYIFQAISYLIDVRDGTYKPERHFGHFAVYLSFFPKLLQGPIERAKDLLPQLKEKYEFNYDNMRTGLLLFAWGMFKKLVIADRAAFFVNYVYDDVYNFEGLALIGATFLYAIQIYCDFSGYTDMALGSARIFNIKLTQNFRSPYLSESITDFWRRWHISLSSWLLDYIFRPVQVWLKSMKLIGNAIAIFITFLLCGFWHGASWSFIVWGAINGIYLSGGLLTARLREKLNHRFYLDRVPRVHRTLKIIITFSMVCFAWVFFRANNLNEAFYVISNLFNGFGNLFFIKQDIQLAHPRWDFFIVILSFFLVEFVYYLDRKKDIFNLIFSRPLLIRWGIYYALTFIIIFFGIFGAKHFLYFKF